MSCLRYALDDRQRLVLGGVAGEAAAILIGVANVAVGGVVPAKQIRVRCPMGPVTGYTRDNCCAVGAPCGDRREDGAHIRAPYRGDDAVITLGSTKISRIVGVLSAGGISEVKIRGVAQPGRTKVRSAQIRTVFTAIASSAVEYAVTLGAEVADGAGVSCGVIRAAVAFVLVVESRRGRELPFRVL
jgi:hypothetical protein